MCWAVGEAARQAAFCSLAPELLTSEQLPMEYSKSARPWKKSFLSVLQNTVQFSPLQTTQSHFKPFRNSSPSCCPFLAPSKKT